MRQIKSRAGTVKNFTPQMKEVINVLTEAEMTDFSSNGLVESICVQETDSGKFTLVVKLTWKEGDWFLVTRRKAVREWTSLDRLVRHIREHYGNPNFQHLIFNYLGFTK